MYKPLILLATAVVLVTAQETGLRAVAKIAEPRGENVQGNVTFTQLADGKVHVEGTILGMIHGKYGFHVHEKGDITGGCGSTGSHFNPENKQHGHPDDENRHIGDMGNIEFDENRIGRIDYVDSKLSLTGPHSIVGRAVVLHEKADDFGRSEHPDSRKTGNAGGRVACGVIGILNPVNGWNINSAPKSSIASAILFPIATFLFLIH